MSIDLNNYEEYFLLYMDNELSAGERKMVEEFVYAHPDLASELAALSTLRLDPSENIEFSGKNELLKPVKEETEAEEKKLEKLLLYIDDELDASEIPSFKQELNTNKRLQQELELIQKTKLAPDMSLVFPDKTVLYRKEKQPARVLVMRLVSISVAAAVILIAGLIWMNNPETSVEQPGTAIAKVEEKQNPDTDEIQENEKMISAEMPAEKENMSQSKEYKSFSAAKEPIKKTAAVPSVKSYANVTSDRSPEKGQTVSPAITLADNRNTEPEFTVAGNSSQRQSVNSTVPAIQQPPVNIRPEQTLAVSITDRPSVSEIKSDYATEALLSAQETVEVVQADTDADHKGPMRGLFRKANRFFNKVTNPDKDGPTVKVASFEIALAK